MYDEDRVESYLRLGHSIGDRLCTKLSQLRSHRTRSLTFAAVW